MRDTNKHSGVKDRELSTAELDAASGGRNEPTKHPAKVTIPDLKLSIAY